MMKVLVVCCLLAIQAVTKANPAVNSIDSGNTVHSITRNQLEEAFLKKLNTKCSERDNHSCMMLKLIVYMNRLFKKTSISISDSLKVVEASERDKYVDHEAEIEDDILLSRALRSDEEALGYVIADKLWQFVRSRTVRYKIHDSAEIVLATEPRGNFNIGLSISPFHSYGVEGRGKMKNMGPLIAIIATKMGIVGALFLKGLLLLAGKALIVSKIALLLAVLIGLKKLLDKKHVTYEVVAHPHHTHETHPPHDSYSNGWARALDGFIDGIASVPAKIVDAQDMAYGGQKKS